MIYTIKLENQDDVINLNEAAFDYEGNLFVNCGSISIDPRSLLALFTLIGREDINLVAGDHSNPNKFIEILRKIENSLIKE